MLAWASQPEQTLFCRQSEFSVTIPDISRDFRLLHWEGVAQ